MNIEFNFLPQRREIITSTLNEVINSNRFNQLHQSVKRNKPTLEYLLYSITYYFSYDQIRKFNAGIYNTDFKNSEFEDKDGELLGSGYYYSVEETGIELIEKTYELFQSKNEKQHIEVPILCLKASEIVEEYAPENYQQLIDNTIGAYPNFELEEEFDARSRFNYLVIQNIERALIRYGESREQTTRELVHKNFRARIEIELKHIPGIIISDDGSYYSTNKKCKQFLNETLNIINMEEQRVLKQKLEIELKKFDSYKKGISRKELIDAQIRKEQGEEVNAPQIYRSKDLKKVLINLLNFKVDGFFISLSLNDFYELFQRDIERFGQVTQRPEEHDISNYLDNTDFQTFIDDNYDQLFHPESNTTFQEEFFEKLNTSKDSNSILLYIFFSQIIYSFNETVFLRDMNNSKNLCSINTSESELKTNEKKRFKKFISTCFDVDINMDDDKEFGVFLLHQKNNLEQILESCDGNIEFDYALFLLKEKVLAEYVSIESKN